MEAIAGLSLAANIFQVIDFTANVLSTGTQIYKSGSTKQNRELGLSTNDFIELTDRLKSRARPDPATSGPLAKDSQNLENLAVESEKIAQELITLLQSNTVRGTPSRSKSILQAIRAAWGARKIEETQKRLQNIRDELQFRILVSIKEDSIKGLDEVSLKILRDIIDSNRVLTATLVSQTDDLTKHRKADGELAWRRHNEVMTAVLERQAVILGINDVTQKIKGKLYFTRQDDRHDDIATAHQKTFDWALQDQVPGQIWPSLIKWLHEGNGVYWVSGKAGSGKSTLMKYLHRDPRLKQALESWTGDDYLITCSYYFWNPGAEIQRSQEGLFRSLLWQVLDQNASLSSQLFPEQYLPGAEWTEFPTFHQLRRAFTRLTTQLRGTKIAIMVDGLDEFDAVRVNMTELAEMFLSAGAWTNVKALVSGRPLPSCEAAFENAPKLRLHELTRNDITIFVDDRLSKHPQIVAFATQSPKKINALISEIVDAASGVFLWVKIVVGSLLEGLQNGDTIQDLHMRLRSLPKELEQLFSHLLNKIPLEYKSESSRFFQLIRCYSQVQYQSLSALGLWYTESSDHVVLKTPVGSLSRLDRNNIEDTVRRRLRSRCAGLLELRPRASARNRQSRGDQVTYLHRSVADYLLREEVWSDILKCTTSTSFNAAQTLLRSSLMEIKVSEFTPMSYGQSNLRSGHLWQLLLNAMRFARIVETTTGNTSLMLLDDLGKSVSSHFVSRPDFLGIDCSKELPEVWSYTRSQITRGFRECPNFLSFTAEKGLCLYVCEKIKQDPTSIKKKGRPLLDYVCKSQPLFNVPWFRLVQVLLHNNANPNEAFNDTSPWINTLSLKYGSHVGKRLEILKEMLRYGADPNVRVLKSIEFRNSDKRNIKQSALRHIQWIFNDVLNRAENDGLTELEEIHLSELGFLRSLDAADYTTGLPLSPTAEAALATLRKDIRNLIALMISKGAREKEWHEVKGVFIPVSSSSGRNLWHRISQAGRGHRGTIDEFWGRTFIPWKFRFH